VNQLTTGSNRPATDIRHHTLEFEGSTTAEGRCRGSCLGCPRVMVSDTESSYKEQRASKGSAKLVARNGLRRIQATLGLLLFLSACVGTFLLATDKSLWLLAVSHAVGLMMIIAIDVVLGVLNLVSWRRAYLPSLALALIGIILQLGDIFTAPQYGLAMVYFADYLFGLWAFDILLALQLAILIVGVVGRPYALSLARRRTSRGRELNLTKRGFLKSLVGLAGAIGIGVLLSSIKISTGSTSSTSTIQTATQSGNAQGSIANINNLKVGDPLSFEYPAGYPNVLLKKPDGSLIALSLLCTHVCCVCTYDPASDAVYCPCHGSVFDGSGNVVQGPASSPLPKVQLRVDGAGNVFPIGVSDPGPCHV